MWKNVHPICGAGIWTHSLQNMSLPPITTRPGLPLNTLGQDNQMLTDQVNHVDMFSIAE